MTVFLVILLVLGLVIELFSLYKGLRDITFRYSLEKEYAEQGEEVNVSVEVANRSLIPASFVGAKVFVPVSAVLPDHPDVKKEPFEQSVDMVFRLWGRQSRSRTLPMRIEKRGVHYFKGANLSCLDFLGLRQAADLRQTQEQILIYPKCLQSQQLISAMGEFYGDMTAQQHLLRDPILTIGVREYTGREPMKTISWSQSVKRGQMMVREFDYTRDLSCTVILATDGMMPTHSDQLDCCCNIVRTVCQEMADRGVNVDFYTNSPKEGFRAKKSAMWKCTATPENQLDLLKGLAFLYPGPAGCSGDVLAVSAARAAGQKTAFVVVVPFRNSPAQNISKILEEYSGSRVMTIYASDYCQTTNEQG